MPNCYNKCSNEYTRSPGTKSDYFCNLKCDSNLTKCPNTDINSLINYNQNYECKSEFVRYGSKCIPKSIAEKCKY